MKEFEKKLEGKVALITGAASGIGASTARLFAAHGATVIVADINRDKAIGVANEILQNGGNAVPLNVDVSSSKQVAKMFETTRKKLEALHILFTCAGIASSGSVESLSESEWNRVLAVNLTGTFLCAKYAIPLIRHSGGGTIVTMSSSTGIATEKGVAAYSASKAGIIMLTRQMALDYARDGIRINCVCPGWIDTPFNNPFIKNPEQHEITIDRTVPMGKQGVPEDVAKAVLYLASDDSPYTTGSVLVIDGGLTVP